VVCGLWFVALSFVTPGFVLAGALLVALPIVIHILNRRRYKIVPWAAMEYLLAAMKKNRRRLKFEQWLLLATRCILLALLGLALARPLGCNQNTIAGLAERTGLHVFILDNSYSMAYEANRSQAKTHLDQARLIARTIVNGLSHGGESVAIITASEPATSIITRPSFDLESARQTFSRIEQTYAATDLAGAMQKALDLARDEKNQPIKKLYILSDSTRSAWEGPQTSAIKDLGRELARQYKITYFNLGKPGQWNQAVLDIHPSSRLVTTKFNNDFLATVKGFGSGPDSILQWKLDGQNLPGGSSVRLDLNTPPQLQSGASLKTGGPHVLAASLASDDRLRIDNERYRIIDVVSELKTLIVEGDRGVGLLSGSAAFLELALAPPPKEPTPNGQPQKSSSYITPETISDLELPNKVLSDYRAVILTNVPQLPEPQAAALEKFVRAGGTLLLFMGEQVNADAYNKILLPHQLIPGPITKRISVGSDQKGYTFDFNPKKVHPLLSLFRGEEKSGLDHVEIDTYLQVELPADTKVERVLNYVGGQGTADRGQGDPAITTHQLGEGHVVFVSTSAGADNWTTLPAKLVHLPLIHELLSESLTPDDNWMNLTVGHQLQIPSTVKLTSTPTLTDIAKKETPLEQVQLKDGQTVYRSRPIATPGLYTLSTGDRTYPIAVNVPAEEADVRTLDVAAIRAALGDIDLTLESDQPPVEISKDDLGKDYGWSLMTLVLVLVAAECFIAMTFGHYRKVSVKRAPATSN